MPVLLSPRASFWPRSRSEGRLRWDERALPDAVVHQAGSEWAASTQRPAPRAKRASDPTLLHDASRFAESKQGWSQVTGSSFPGKIHARVNKKGNNYK